MYLQLPQITILHSQVTKCQTRNSTLLQKVTDEVLSNEDSCLILSFNWQSVFYLKLLESVFIKS